MLAKFKKADNSYEEVLYSKTDKYERLDENLVVPSEGTFVRLKHWDELGAGDNDDDFPEMFIPRYGIELVGPDGRVYDYVPLPEKWQYFLWDFWDWASQYRLPDGKIEEFYKRPNNDRIFAKTSPGSLSYVYVDMAEAHRCFTDAGSPEAGARDFVMKRNMSNPRNFEWLFNPTGGAMVKVLRTIGQYYEIEALDVLKPPPPISYVIDRPWLYFWCVQYSRVNGSTRFPQIKTANSVHGLPPAGIPSPLLSKGGTFRVLKSSCVRLTNGQPWTPYKPK